MTARRTLIGFLLMLVVLGVVDAQFMKPGAQEPALLMAGQTLAISYVLFSWYCSDGNERGFVRPRLLSISMVFLSVLVIPYYLVSSRPAGKRLLALLKFAGMCVLSFCALLAGTFAGLLV